MADDNGENGSGAFSWNGREGTPQTMKLASFRWSRLLCALGLVLVCSAAASAADKTAAPKMPPAIGPTPIRFYSGNLSVGLFQHYWDTRKDDNYDPITPDKIAQLKRCNCTAMCDYLAWCTAEREPGQWDFSFYRNNADMLRKAGIKYNPFCWLHFPPKWYEQSDKFVPYQNQANGKTIPQMSLWSPETRRIYAEFYKRMAAALGQRVDFIRLAMPSEYGEIGYCTGMTKWLRPQPDAEPGYWCGDKHAHADFTRKMMARYGTIEAINKAWKKSYRSESDIAMPDVTGDYSVWFKSDTGRTHWLDFIEWYQQSWPEFMTEATQIVRKYYPNKEIIFSLGYGEERAAQGNDIGRHVARMAQLKAAAQTPGAIGYLPTRRVSSACRAYGVPYYTEPPGAVSREQQVARIWMDASNGTQTWFDYPGNLDGARDVFVKYKRHLTGKPPVCDLGLWLPTYHHWLRPNEGYPVSMHDTANHIRDLCDYEVVDDGMIRDGALDKLAIRVLALIEAQCLDGQAIDALERWLQKGGVLITFEPKPAMIRNGDGSRWSQLIPNPPKPTDLIAPKEGAGAAVEIGETHWSMKKLWATGQSVGQGRVLVVPGADLNGRERSDIIAHFNHYLADYGPYANGPLIDGHRDRVQSTLLADRILMFNETDKPITRKLQLRATDFGGRVGTPTKLDQDITLKPNEIVAVSLRLSGKAVPRPQSRAEPALRQPR